MDGGDALLGGLQRPLRAPAVVGLAVVAVGQDPRQHVLRVRLALLGRARVPLLGDGAVGRAVLAVEVEVAEQALAQRHRRPWPRASATSSASSGVALDAPAVDEAAADLGLRARRRRHGRARPRWRAPPRSPRAPPQRRPRPCARPSVGAAAAASRLRRYAGASARLRAVETRRQLRAAGAQEARLVVEAAQVEDQRAVLDAADDRDRQAAERGGQRLQPACRRPCARRA